MRKSNAEAARTRRRIVETAAAEFRRKGIHAAGLAELMAAAGLTHGGFYRHFDSKCQLIAEACAAGMEGIAERAEAAESKDCAHGGLESVVASYLSLAHRDNRSGGCPLAALGSELARADDATREQATKGFLRLVDIVARHYPDEAPEAARAHALATLSTMIGAMTLSRIVKDPALSASILEQAKASLLGQCKAVEER